MVRRIQLTDCRLRVTRHQQRKSGRIDDSQLGNTEHSSLTVHHSHLIGVLAHLAGARGVPNGCCAGHDVVKNVGVGLYIKSGVYLLAGHDGLQGRGVSDLAGALERCDGELLVARVGQEARVDDGVDGRICAVDGHVAAAEGGHESGENGHIVAGVPRCEGVAGEHVNASAIECICERVLEVRPVVWESSCQVASGGVAQRGKQILGETLKCEEIGSGVGQVAGARASVRGNLFAQESCVCRDG